jgi:uncharacterized membrane protein
VRNAKGRRNSSAALVIEMKKEYLLRLILAISVIGLLFSGYLSFIELGGLGGSCRVFSEIIGLPTCVYGFFMYLIIFVLTLLYIAKSRNEVKS